MLIPPLPREPNLSPTRYLYGIWQNMLGNTSFKLPKLPRDPNIAPTPLLNAIWEATKNGMGGLPNQTGHAGEFLTTDGATASWGAIPGGGDMLSANNLSDVASVATARTNLGGTAVGIDLFTAANAAAARAAIGAGTSSLVGSLGGNGAADSGKAALFGAAGGLIGALFNSSNGTDSGTLTTTGFTFFQGASTFSGVINMALLSANRTWTLPDASGTLALLSDIPAPPSSIVGITGTIAEFNAALTDAVFATGGGTASGANTGDQSSIVGITGTLAEFDAALTDGNFATGGGTANGVNTGDQTSIVGITGTMAQFNTALTDDNFAFLGVANTFAAAGAASVSPFLMSGAIMTGGTGTTNFPHFLIQPTGATAATTWNASGTAFGINLNIAAGNFIDCKVDGVTSFSVSQTGAIVSNLFGVNLTFADSPGGTVRGSFNGGRWSGTDGFSKVSEVGIGVTGSPQVAILNTGTIGWSANATFFGTIDLILVRDAAGILAQRNGVNAQTHRIYGAYTDASNYVRASLGSSSTIVTLAAETAGTGADDIDLALTPAGTGRVRFGAFAADVAVVLAGSIEIKDSGGTVRKVAIVN